MTTLCQAQCQLWRQRGARQTQSQPSRSSQLMGKPGKEARQCSPGPHRPLQDAERGGRAGIPRPSGWSLSRTLSLGPWLWGHLLSACQKGVFEWEGDSHMSLWPPEGTYVCCRRGSHAPAHVTAWVTVEDQVRRGGSTKVSIMRGPPLTVYRPEGDPPRKGDLTWPRARALVGDRGVEKEDSHLLSIRSMPSAVPSVLFRSALNSHSDS